MTLGELKNIFQVLGKLRQAPRNNACDLLVFTYLSKQEGRQMLV